MIIFVVKDVLGVLGTKVLQFMKGSFKERCDVRGVSGGALNWAPMMPRDASLSDSYAVVFAPCFCDVRGVSGGPQLAPHDAERR